MQTRPITTTGSNNNSAVEASARKKETTLELVLQGAPASPGIKSGPVKILANAKEIHRLNQGDILVADQTNPDYVPAMKKAVAIVTDKGGRTSHAAIVSRELGIPAVVGTKNATQVLKNGEVITVSGTKGEVYKGGLLTSSHKGSVQVYEDIKTATKVYVNLAEPELAQKTLPLNPDGVGLLRAEFMMAKIGVHPKRMIKNGKKKEFIDKLSEGLLQFCKTFNPKPVIYRASDFKTNEYRDLIGGKEASLIWSWRL